MAVNLSVFFNIDRTYITFIEQGERGLKLLYAGATDSNIDLENITADNFNLACDELLGKIKSQGYDVNRMTVTVPAETVLVSVFPGRSGITTDELVQLVNLEIRQAYPQFDYGEFTSSVVPLAKRADNKEMIMSVIIMNHDIDIYRQILNPVRPLIDSIEISQLNAHSAFSYNYPEYQGKIFALLGIQNNFADISLISGKQPLYYNLASLPPIGKFGNMLENEIEKLTGSYFKKLDGIFFFGTGLTKEHIEAARDHLGKKIKIINKLNAFRMMRTALSQREREYCIRTGHIFPPCVGGSLPAYHERFKLQ